MHTAHKGRNFGSKVIAVIDHVDHATKRIHGRLKDNGVIAITVIDVPPTFVWPRPGEYWYVRKENYHWRLETKMDLRNDFKIEDLLPGESRVSSTELRNENGDYFLLPYYGSFHDHTTQTNPVPGATNKMIFSDTDFANGVSIVTSDGKASRITFEKLGYYNIQFSAQIQNTDTSIRDIEIWLSHQGNDVAATNTTLSITASHGGVPGRTVAAWNFFVNVNTLNQYFELLWASASSQITMPSFTATYGPTIPSVILTVNRIG